MRNRFDTIIVGAGPAGLSVANHMKGDFIVLEKENTAGGLMRSKTLNGYIFDYAGHIFFTQIDRILHAVQKLLRNNLKWHNRESWVYSKNTFTRYPFQANTYGLPPDIIKECLMGLIEATYHPQKTLPENFKEWIEQTYGHGIANHFMIPYNEKLWARDLTTMDFQWLKGRVPQPGLEDFINGALTPGRKDMGPNARFGYPTQGGMQSLANTLIQPIRDKIITGKNVKIIDVNACQIITDSDESFHFNHLILTSPLTDIITQIDEIPQNIANGLDTLDSLPVTCVNVGIKEPRNTQKHWIYFPEPEFLFHRIFVQGNASDHVCPPGCFSYTAEITHNHRKQITAETAKEKTVDGLIHAGLIANRANIEVIDLIEIPVGYVIPTHNRNRIIDDTRQWLLSKNIHLVGRFAEWAYYNMDHALNAGWTLAEQMNEK